jgi:hypothetical protein
MVTSRILEGIKSVLKPWVAAMTGETHGTLGTLVGLDKHLQEQPSSEKLAQSMEEN